MKNAQRLIDIITEAYPGTEVLLRTNNHGRVFVRDPSTTTIQTPALYFANVFKDDPDAHIPKPLWSYKAYAPTLEQALILAINLRDPQLLANRGYES